jgi:uncharacterized alkaline shock family protein YloU
MAIAAGAALETEGVEGLSNSPGKELSDLIGKKSLSKGVRVKVADDAICVDIFIIVKAGNVVSAVGKNVQEAVKTSVEATTGLTVSAVTVHVSGVTFR